jgi:hypothetical protein
MRKDIQSLISAIVYLNLNLAPFKPAELTEDGKQGAVKKGIEFKNRFNLLIQEDIKLNELLSTYSSNMFRNLQTLYYKVKGIFSDHPDYHATDIISDKCIEDFLYKLETVIPTEDEDFMFKLFDKVRDSKPALDECIKSDSYKDIIAFSENLLKSHYNLINRYYASGLVYENQSEPFKLFFISDYLMRSEINKVELDDEEKLLKKDIEEFKFYEKFIKMITVSSENIFRLSSSCLYRTLLKHFDEKIEGKGTNIVLLSSHDTNLSSLAYPLQIDNINYDFNDELTFILCRGGDEYYICVEYNSQKVPIKFHDESYYCKYSYFKKHIQEKINDVDDIVRYLNGEISCLKNKI